MAGFRVGVSYESQLRDLITSFLKVGYGASLSKPSVSRMLNISCSVSDKGQPQDEAETGRFLPHSPNWSAALDCPEYFRTLSRTNIERGFSGWQSPPH